MTFFARWRPTLAVHGLILTLLAFGQTKAFPIEPSLVVDGILMENDVIFGKGGDHDLHADMAFPTNMSGSGPQVSGSFPAVIYVHGGGWFAGSYKNDSLLIHLAKQGYVAASIEYRLTNVAKWPVQIQDCKLAVRWLRANAEKYHVDPNRIGVCGDSAGGHLVACLGTMADVKEFEGDGGYPGVSSAVQAVVDYYGPTDFIHPEIYTPGAAQLTMGLFGVPRDQNPALWKSGSPLFYVKAGDPPMLLVHGDSDDVVPLAQSIVFDAALTKAGVPHQFIVVKNANHGFAPLPGKPIEPTREEIQKATDDFLAQYLKKP